MSDICLSTFSAVYLKLMSSSISCVMAEWSRIQVTEAIFVVQLFLRCRQKCFKKKKKTQVIYNSALRPLTLIPRGRGLSTLYRAHTNNTFHFCILPRGTLVSSGRNMSPKRNTRAPIYIPVLGLGQILTKSNQLPQNVCFLLTLFGEHTLLKMVPK